METDFVNWLITEMNQRGWSNSELARRADVVPSAVSMLVSGQTNPGVSMCQGLANAFKLPVETVYRKAGLLPELPAPENDPTLGELLSYARRLSAADRREVLKYALFRYQGAQERPAPATNAENGEASAGGPSAAPAR